MSLLMKRAQAPPAEFALPPALVTKPRTNERRRAVTIFVSYSVLVLVVVSGVDLVLARALARNDALNDARAAATNVTRAVVVPSLERGLSAGDEGALARLDQALRPWIANGSMDRIKIWDASGTIVYSDDPRLIGGTYPFDEDAQELLGSTNSLATAKDLEAEDSLVDDPRGSLVEVHSGFVTPWGEPMIFEGYVSSDRLASETVHLWRTIAPMSLGSLLLFAVLVLPMALGLARRVEDSQREQDKLQRHCISASDRERRRIGQELHDGVLQDLAGLGYALSAMAGQATDPKSEALLREASRIVSGDGTAIRAVLADVIPPSLAATGLHDAVGELLQPLRESGTNTANLVPHDLVLSEQATRCAQLVFREALQNVRKHAHASTVTVRASLLRNELRLEVADDGIGISPGGTEGANGHVGLGLLAEMLIDIGGRLTVGPTEGSQGTRVRASIPLLTGRRRGRTGQRWIFQPEHKVGSKEYESRGV